MYWLYSACLIRSLSSSLTKALLSLVWIPAKSWAKGPSSGSSFRISEFFVSGSSLIEDKDETGQRTFT